ncbi:MAG: damage-inducible protein DinB, partial [Mesorhizobium sp.]
MKQHFMMFAAYNQWANGRIYEAAADLVDEEFERDVGAFFGSMAGTLNHLLAADRIWMKRFTGEGDAPSRTDAILHRALPVLWLAREAEDK